MWQGSDGLPFVWHKQRRKRRNVVVLVDQFSSSVVDEVQFNRPQPVFTQPHKPRDRSAFSYLTPSLRFRRVSLS